MKGFRSLGRGVLLVTLLYLAGNVSALPTTAHAQTLSDIQAQIADRNTQIASLEADIATYQKQLDALGTQHATLSSSIKSLDISRAKLTSEIKATQAKIDQATLELQALANEISDKEQTIAVDKKTLAASLRDMQATDDTSLVEQVFTTSTLADVWSVVDENASVGAALRTHADELSQVTQTLNQQHQVVGQTQAQLSSLSTDLTTQEKALDVSKQAKTSLLAQTQNKESTYQTLIATKKAQEKSFEAELTTLEGQLKSVGSGSIPTVGQGILAWPYSVAFAAHCPSIAAALNPSNNFCITQFFGNTSFSTANPSIYNGSGHNGIDIGMPIGTPVQAALSGVVLGTGNTDLAGDAAWTASGGTRGSQCLSFGKWVMVKHANGLDTLYAHLSQITATKGQAVTTGQVLGYSGMTGYATGPHLHFGVYAAAGVQILTLNQFRGANTPCANASMPVAPLNAYLNPMSYL